MISRSSTPLEFIETSVGAMCRVVRRFDTPVVICINAGYVDVHVSLLSDGVPMPITVSNVPRTATDGEFCDLVKLSVDNHCRSKRDVAVVKTLAIVEWSTIVELVERYAVANGL